MWVRISSRKNGSPNPILEESKGSGIRQRPVHCLEDTLHVSPSEQTVDCDCGLIITIPRSRTMSRLAFQEQRTTQIFILPPLCSWGLQEELPKGDVNSDFHLVVACMPALEEEVYIVPHLHVRSPWMPRPRADPGD